MKKVNYAKLSEQYANFLVAVGGVSITVLTLVLGLSSREVSLSETEIVARVYLVAALTAATVSCFIGAHMMAETAAHFTNYEEKITVTSERISVPLGHRLFVLATSNIFVAVTLVLFSIVLLPMATGNSDIALSLRFLFYLAFIGILSGALVWMALAAIDRTGVGKKGSPALIFAGVVGLITGVLCYGSTELKPQLTFMIVVTFTVALLFYFAFIFWRRKACSQRRCIVEIGFCTSGITICYALLVVAILRLL
jgi:hypothetical protein